MRIHAILNAKAGSLIDLDLDEFAEIIKHALRDERNEVRVDLVEPQKIDAAMESALAESIDVLVVGGGDGTIKAAATKLIGRDIALGVIPLGTLNLLARDLRIPFDPEEAATVIGRGKPDLIDMAEVNGSFFLCCSLLGLPIRMAEKRQELRGTGLLTRLGGLFEMLRDFIANRRRFAIEIDDGRYPHRVRALSIAISNNPFAEVASKIPTRSCIDSGQLALYVSTQRTGGVMGLTILQRMLGIWNRNPEIKEFCAGRIVLRSSRRKVRVSNDGEIEELAMPLTYSIHPRSLRVIRPEKTA